MNELRVFAPATVANLGPGFDLLGLALTGPGDTVTVRVRDEPGVLIRAIRGDSGRLPLEAHKNTAGIAAAAVLAQAGIDRGLELEIDKGMPLGSGLGSSAASAAAAAVGANRLLGAPLSPLDLIGCCIEAEAAVSGRHADNVAPAVLGGLVLVRTLDPLDIHRLPIPAGLQVVVTTPEFELSTRLAREALPTEVPMPTLVENAANLAALIHALHCDDLELLGRALVDRVVTPARAGLIPGCDAVIAAARESGALGASISGAGPSIFALCRSESDAANAGGAMAEAFTKAGLASSFVISPAASPGARLL